LIIIAALVLLFGAYIAVLNWVALIINRLNRKRGIDKHYSPNPLISIICAGIAYFIYPFQPKGWIVLIPLLDIGNWQLIIGLPIAIAKVGSKK
jgi:hypothetical protein